MLQRFTVQLPTELSHIYLEPNMPEKYVREELSKKFSDWELINYNANKISNMQTMKQGGLATQSYAKGGESTSLASQEGISKLFGGSYKGKSAKITGKSPQLIAAKAALKAGQLAQKAAKQTWKATQKAGRFVWEAAEDAAPALWEQGRKTGQKIAEKATSTATDLTSYGLTKLEQYQKYRLLQTHEAKTEFNRIMRKYKLGTLEHKGETVESFKKALDVAIKKAAHVDEQATRQLLKGEHGMIVFDKFDVPSVNVYEYALDVKKNYPKSWKLGGNNFGNTAFKNLEKVVNRGYWLDSEEWMYKKWKQHINEHRGDKKANNIIRNLKWLTYSYNELTDISPKIGKIVSAEYAHYKYQKGTVVPAENKLGGYDFAGDEEKVAKNVDLITLPEKIEGTNCANCTYMLIYNKEKGSGFCYHPKVLLPVTARMCCALWDNLAVERTWKFEHGGSPLSFGEGQGVRPKICGCKHNPKNLDYYAMMQEGSALSTETLVKVDENDKYPSNDEAKDLMEITGSENHYLYNKDVSTWDENDLRNYNEMNKTFAKEQLQNMYDSVNDKEGKNKFIYFAQKCTLIPQDTIRESLNGTENFKEVCEILHGTGYLNLEEDNPYKYAEGGAIAELLSTDFIKKEKEYAMTKTFDGKEYLIAFKLLFDKVVAEDTTGKKLRNADDTDYQYEYKPFDWKITAIGDMEGKPQTLDYADLLQAEEAIYHFMLSHGEAQEWHVYEKGGDINSPFEGGAPKERGMYTLAIG